MYALAWMSSRENKKNLGVRGGILADDMGLGKTLSILSLILTNFHDKRPLAKPIHGYRRTLTKNCRKFMPQAKGKKNSASTTGVLNRLEEASLEKVGKKCIPKNQVFNVQNLFGKLKKTERAGGGREVKR